jgi:hypothetical protein
MLFRVKIVRTQETSLRQKVLNTKKLLKNSKPKVLLYNKKKTPPIILCNGNDQHQLQ